jgi:hypothetical protein
MFERPSPDDSLVRFVREKGHGHCLKTFAYFNRIDTVATAGQVLTLYAKHSRYIRTVNVGVKNSNFMTPESQRSSQVDGYGTFPHTTLAAHDHNLVANVEESLL